MKNSNKGRLSPAELRSMHDPKTGALVNQVTNSSSINHHLYFLVSSWPDDMSRLFFVSHRTRAPNLFSTETETGKIRQLTDRDDLNEWSAVPSRDGKWLYFTARNQVLRLNIDSLDEETVDCFQGFQAGNCSLSADGSFLAVPVRREGVSAITRAGQGQSQLVLIRTKDGDAQPILERDVVGHVQFCPDDPQLILYSGPPTERLWVIKRDGSENRQLYEQAPNEWVTHETWLPRTKEVLFVRWPEALEAVSLDGEKVRTVASFNVWHPSCSRNGSYIVCDTNHPDIGLQLIDPETGRHQTPCYPEASSVGEHWKGPFPYAKDLPKPKIYAPQWTHPHPSFSPDGKQVVYTSDRSGYSQVYVVNIAEDNSTRLREPSN